MKTHSISGAWTRAASIGVMLLAIAADARAGRIDGLLLAADDTPAVGVTVVVCDAGTGAPLRRHDARPFTEGIALDGERALEFLVAITSDEGRFSIEVPDGRYRLVAQSWAGVDTPVTEPLAENGVVVELHGVAADVLVDGPAPVPIEIRPLGTASVSVDVSFPNDDALIVVSTAAPRADPILGFAGWTGPFCRDMLGGNRMLGGRTTFRGLPAGTVHLALFANDNLPGFGAAAVTLAEGEKATVPVKVVASWSNGHHDPPPHLVELTARVRALGQAEAFAIVRAQLPEFLDVPPDKRLPPGVWTHVVRFLDRRLRLPDDGPNDEQVNFGDFWAAKHYADLREFLERRADAGRALEQVAPDAAPGYERAFRDLHAVLGRRYPGFALKGIDWSSVGGELLPRVAAVEDDATFGLLCLELVARLEDSHAVLLPGSSELPVVDVPRWDPGFACLEDDRGLPVVYHVDPGGPADDAGVRVGTTVVAIDGVPAAERVEQTITELRRYRGFSSERAARYQAFRALPRSRERGQFVELELVDPGGARRSLSLQASVEARYLPRLPVPIAGVRDDASVSWRRLDDGVGYIYVRRIRRDLIAKLDAAIAELWRAPGIIIDVRGNSGGGFDAALAHRSFDLDRGDENPDQPWYRGPIAMLIDARCISAGEGWASWFVAHERATLFGEATAGASGRKTVYMLSNGVYQVRYPVKLYRGYLDRPIERRGLEPDVPVKPNAADLATGRDTVLEAAREYLLEKKRRKGPNASPN